MAHVINSFLFFCWPAFVTGIVFAGSSLVYLMRDPVCRWRR